MPVNWVEFERDIDSIIDEGSTETDKTLASRMSSVTRMTDDEIKEIFPETADIQKLARLMNIVKSADDRNTKINNIVARAEEFGEIALKLLEKSSLFSA